MKLMKALLFVSSCLLLFAVACGSDGDDSLSGGSGGAAATGAPTGPDIGSTSANTLPFDDKLILTTNVELEVEHLRGVYDTISRTTRDFGGFVAEARIGDGEGDPTAFLRLRVPASLHDELLTAIRNVGDGGVKREDSRAVEVTAEYTDLESRLRNLQITEAQYRQLLESARSIDEILQVTARIDSVRGDMEQVQGRLNLLDDQTGFATISVSLSTLASATSSLAPPLEVLVTALETSLVVAHATANVLIVLLIAGLWVIPGGVAVMLIWKRFRRQFHAVWAWLN